MERDREKTAEKIRNDLNQEKIELKKILNEELGLFKRDTTIVEAEEPQKDIEESFTFEFSEEPDSTSEVKTKREKGRWRKKNLKKDSTQN